MLVSTAKMLAVATALWSLAAGASRYMPDGEVMKHLGRGGRVVEPKALPLELRRVPPPTTTATGKAGPLTGDHVTLGVPRSFATSRPLAEPRFGTPSYARSTTATATAVATAAVTATAAATAATLPRRLDPEASFRSRARKPGGCCYS